MSAMTSWLDRSLYPGSVRNWDDKLFRDYVAKHLTTQSVVLDLGAGAGIIKEMNFRGCVARVYGVDLDPRVTGNAALDDGRVANASCMPFPDATFDVVFANNVMEHLSQPLEPFQEVFRVLKPGGMFLFKTPNKFHYMPTIARLTPHRFHRFFNNLRGRMEVDTFPTFYRANAEGDVRRLAKAVGFAVEGIQRIEGRPEYTRMSLPTYLLGACYERLVNATEMLSLFRILLIAELRKPPLRVLDD